LTDSNKQPSTIRAEAEVLESLLRAGMSDDELAFNCIEPRQFGIDMANCWRQADEVWDQQQNESAFGAYVSADHLQVLPELLRLKKTCTTFLEFGSGLGVFTILASRLGFEAYGIESESVLVEHSRRFANEFGRDASFALGSFLPDDFQWDPSQGEEVHVTDIQHADGYGELGMEICDFDLIYAYPWPTEHELYRNVVDQFAAQHAKLLLYDAREGVLIHSRKQ